MGALSQEERQVVICSSLAGRKIMVMESDFLVSMVIEDILTDQQSVVIGPFAQLQPALEAAQSDEIDFALLDVGCQGAEVSLVAEALSMRQIPFLVLSSFGTDALPANTPAERLCSKPFSGTVLVMKMLEELNRT